MKQIKFLLRILIVLMIYLNVVLTIHLVKKAEANSIYHPVELTRVDIVSVGGQYVNGWQGLPVVVK